MKRLILILLIGLFVSVGVVHALPPTGGADTLPAAGAADTGPQKIVKLDNPLNKEINSIQKLLLAIVDLAILIGTVVAVLMFLWVGFKFVAARGNESEIKEAKQWFLYAVIGTAILLSSKVIVVVIGNTLISAGVVDEKLLRSNKVI